MIFTTVTVHKLQVEIFIAKFIIITEKRNLFLLVIAIYDITVKRGNNRI